MEDEELIRLRMVRTREALSEKVETLEKRLTDSVQEGAETLKNVMDIQAHFERHPLLLLGGSLLGGYLLANLLGGKPKRQETGPPAAALPPQAPSEANGRVTYQGENSPDTKENWLGEFAPEIDHLKRLALGVALGTVREAVISEAPPQMAEHLRAIMDGLTRKVGGEVLPRSDWSAPRQPDSPPDESSAEGGIDLNQPRW